MNASTPIRDDERDRVLRQLLDSDPMVSALGRQEAQRILGAVHDLEVLERAAEMRRS